MSAEPSELECQSIASYQTRAEHLRGSLSFTDDELIIHSSCPTHQANSRSKRSAISGSATMGNALFGRNEIVQWKDSILITHRRRWWSFRFPISRCHLKANYNPIARISNDCHSLLNSNASAIRGYPSVFNNQSLPSVADVRSSVGGKTPPAVLCLDTSSGRITD